MILPVMLIIYMVVWLWRNNILVSVAEFKEGVFIMSSKRCRLVKEKLYPIWCFWYRFGKPISVPIEVYEKCNMVSEGLPIVGIKQQLKLKKDADGLLIPWMPPDKLPDDGLISNMRVVRISGLRTELYESTKSELTRQELLMRIAIPMGLIILALAMIIFFPKIYEVVSGGTMTNYETARQSVFDWLGQAKPAG